MLRSLFRHQAWADRAILAAVRAHPGAAEDEYLCRMLHHIGVVQRYFVSLIEGRAFDYVAESRQPKTMDEFDSLFGETHATGTACVDRLEDGQLGRVLALERAPQLRPTVGEALIQVVMHSQSHRGQCASRLRVLGATPPTVDFILWLNERP
jgi:uncharacterized damage-inducible protein DinB